MKNFLKKAIEEDGISPSEVCLQSFNDNFSDAVNVEWTSKEGYHETIFYRNNIEHIAIFSLFGILLEYRQNLPADFIPDPIKNLALSKGEIMNAVLKNMGNMLEYELIIRDTSLQRHLVVFSDLGEIKEESLL